MMKRIVTDFLDELLMIRSYQPGEKQRCAKVLMDKLINMGFKGEIVKDYGSPIVFATYDARAKKNILFYTHYDVKPEGDISVWNSDPFVPVYDNKVGKVFARGAGDDKGQIFAVLCGIKAAFMENRSLSYNITIIIEGDEESGSLGLDEFCIDKLSKKKYEAVIINDSHWLGNIPVIYTGARGQQSVNILYTLPDMDENLHAGNYGGKIEGAARDFISILGRLLEQMDGVIKMIPTTAEEYGNAVSLTYISSGDSKRSTIPRSAFAKVDIRFVEAFVPYRIHNLLEEAKKNYGITYEIIQQNEGFYNQKEDFFVNRLIKIIRNITGLEPIVSKYCGAYLPMKSLQSINGIKYVIPFAQADEHNHSPNENISLRHIAYGAEIIKEILL